jgi:hypothetical protein
MASLTYGSVIGAGPGYTVVSTPFGPMTVRGDRATRNNNPGNIEAGAYANSQGAIGTDGRFAVFGSRLTGTRAQKGLIFGKNYANLTLRQAIAKYAPPSENNSAAYAAAVAAAAGVSLDTKMKDIPADKRDAVVKGMQDVEGNTNAGVYDSNGNLVGTIDTVSPRTPATAPTPYGPDSQMADTTPGAPIGTVTRAPLGPAAPAPAAMGALAPANFSGLATPRGIGAPSAPTPSSPPSNMAMNMAAPAPSRSMGALAPANPAASSAPSPDRPDNHNDTGPIGLGGPGGLYMTQEAADAATAATKAAASAERRAAAEAAAQATPQAAPAAPAQPAPTVAAPKANIPASVVPAAAPAAVPARTAVPANSRPSLAMSNPGLSPADVYGGAIGTAQTSTPGVTVSRANSYGPSYVTNQFGVTTAVSADGTQMATSGVPKASDISGPLSNTGIATNPTSGGIFGPKAKSATGAITGAALGSYALGPLGGLLGAAIGKNLAQGKSPFAGILGSQTNSFGLDPSSPGGAFPTAPANPRGYTPTSSNRSMAGMQSISPGAAAAIGMGQGGLY